MFFVYLLKCRDGSYYCGYTNNLQRRVRLHNAGKGGRYTRSRQPVRLVYFKRFKTKSQALRREHQIKALSRKQKRELVFKRKKPAKTNNKHLAHDFTAGMAEPGLMRRS